MRRVVGKVSGFGKRICASASLAGGRFEFVDGGHTFGFANQLSYLSGRAYSPIISSVETPNLASGFENSGIQMWLPLEKSGAIRQATQSCADYVDAVCNDAQSKVVIEGIESRVSYVESLYVAIHWFFTRIVKSDVLTRLHTDPPGVGKSLVTQQALKWIPSAMPGLAVAYVPIAQLKMDELIPSPRYLLQQAKEDSDGKVSKLFIMYDDFEVCYDREDGPAFTRDVYIEADKNLEIMCHVMSSSQWLRELLPRHLPIPSLMPDIYANRGIPNQQKYKYYGGCATIGGGRTNIHGYICGAIVTKNELKVLVEHMCDVLGIGSLDLNDDKLLEHIQWVASGNASEIEKLLLLLTKTSPDEQKEEYAKMMDQLYRDYNEIQDKVSPVFDEILSKLLCENDYLAPRYGSDDKELVKYWKVRNPFDIKTVHVRSLYFKYFNDLRENRIGIVKGLIDNRLLTLDADWNVHPAKLAHLAIHAMGGMETITQDEATRSLTQHLSFAS